MIQAGNQNYNTSKPVGIVLTKTYEIDKSILWDNYLTQVADNITALEASVYECALAGCSSVWVCCDETTQPLIRERLGDYVKDPVQVSKSMFTRHPRDNHVLVPIYYYMVHPRDRQRRSGTCWDAINTALTIYYVSKKMSRWLIPDKYYISFANGLYDFSEIKNAREELRKAGNICFSFKGDTFLDGSLTSFTLTGNCVKNLIYNLKRESKVTKNNVVSFADVSRFINLEGYFFLHLDEYYSCISWQEYVKYMRNKKFNYNFDRDYFFKTKSYGVF